MKSISVLYPIEDHDNKFKCLLNKYKNKNISIHKLSHHYFIMIQLLTDDETDIIFNEFSICKPTSITVNNDKLYL